MFCLHPSEGSSRTFARFLPEIAEDRSAYAPDLPGHGESDSAPTRDSAAAAAAVSDLAADLRLRQIDVLGLRFGAGVALRTRRRPARAGSAPRADRRAAASIGCRSSISETLVLRVKLGTGDDSQWAKGVVPRAQFIDLAEYSADLFDASPRTLAKQIGAFLKS